MSTLPLIPNKRYFTIGEVSTLCAVKPHVLRYWEQEFSNLRPSKRRGNRRYYRLEDVVIVRQIKSLLYDQGFTISGARMQLISGVAAASNSTAADFPAPFEGGKAALGEGVVTNPQQLLTQLEEVLALLS